MKDENKTSTGDVSENNLEYSFDFAGATNDDSTGATSTEEGERKLVDVSVPVMNANENNSTVSAESSSPVSSQVEAVSEPLADNSVSSQGTVSEPSADNSVSGQETVSEPSADNSVSSQETVSSEVQDESNGKGTFGFIMVIVVIIAAFIAALPFIIKALG